MQNNVALHTSWCIKKEDLFFFFLAKVSIGFDRSRFSCLFKIHYYCSTAIVSFQLLFVLF